MLYGKQSGVFESRDLDEVFSFRVLDENVVIHAQGVILGQKVIVAKYRAAAVQADGNNEIDHDEFLMWSRGQLAAGQRAGDGWADQSGAVDDGVGRGGDVVVDEAWGAGAGGEVDLEGEEEDDDWWLLLWRRHTPPLATRAETYESVRLGDLCEQL
ncbi:hypothetical protein GX48_01870 [Paracoccidioides brasiliensis]|nr:hypothetical protein GX48_01870 [Paracoccidioides brasiliensis]